MLEFLFTLVISVPMAVLMAFLSQVSSLLCATVLSICRCLKYLTEVNGDLISLLGTKWMLANL